MWVVWLVFLRGKRGSIATIAAVVSGGEEESSLLSPYIYNPYKCAGCLGIGPRLFLPLFWVILGWFLIQFSPRIGRSILIFVGFSVSLLIQKSTAKKYVIVADSEIGNEELLLIQKSAIELCRYPFKNQHPKTMPPIQKTAELCCCRFRNW